MTPLTDSPPCTPTRFGSTTAATPLTELVERARMLQTALDAMGYRILQRVHSPGRLAVAFILSGRHVGPLVTPAGTIAPTGRSIEIPTIDVLEFSDDLIDTVWVVSDQLGILLQTGALEPWTDIQQRRP